MKPDLVKETELLEAGDVTAWLAWRKSNKLAVDLDQTVQLMHFHMNVARNPGVSVEKRMASRQELVRLGMVTEPLMFSKYPITCLEQVVAWCLPIPAGKAELMHVLQARPEGVVFLYRDQRSRIRGFQENARTLNSAKDPLGTLGGRIEYKADLQRLTLVVLNLHRDKFVPIEHLLLGGYEDLSQYREKSVYWASVG